MNETLPAIQAAPSRALTTSATPSDLLRIAVETGADLDRLERLMALQERWEATEARKAYDIAFTAFKDEAVRIIKNRGVTDGPLKGKRYAELFAVVNAVTPALSKHGLSASWKLTKDDKDWLEVTCTLKHVGGHFEAVSMGGPPDTGGAKNAIQARASTVSYLERYTLKAITGLSEQDDDKDGRSPEVAAETTVPSELLAAGSKAAKGGVESYRKWWSGLEKKDRQIAQHEHETWKLKAQEADAARKPSGSNADFVADIERAEAGERA